MQFLPCYPRISPSVNTVWDKESAPCDRCYSRIDEALNRRARAGHAAIAGIEREEPTPTMLTSPGMDAWYENLPREVTKKIWAYIKKQNLQNPQNKREILDDNKLQPIFGGKKMDTFQMAKAVNKHLK